LTVKSFLTQLLLCTVYKYFFRYRESWHKWWHTYFPHNKFRV